MRSILQTISALPIRDLGRRPDIILAFGVAAIVAMLVIPLPTPILDALLALNIAAGIIVLMVALFAKRALDVSSFPSLLLVTTLFRLGLNVSTTRGILARADAGEVVRSFGEFVLSGDVVVGFVIFLVITLVQFLVIAKGAERVAEVGARFTLDAMPGKQMAIDAALRAGALDDEEAQRRRTELGRESQLFGNMDGAMKFVKGDAIAGLVITALNLIAGMIIGILRNGMPAAEAAQVYSILTVGDGLVSQISALLITLAAGILVTRVQGADDRSNLGHLFKSELGGNTTVLNVAAVLMLGLGLVPGLPFVPFSFIAVLLLAVGASRTWLKRYLPKSLTKVEADGSFEGQLEKKVAAAKKQKAVTDQIAPSVVPLGIDLDPVLTDALDEAELVDILIPQLRDALYTETGVRFPGVRVRTSTPNLPRSSFLIRVKDVPVLQVSIAPDRFLAIASPKELVRIGVIGEPAEHPVSGAPVASISAAQRDAVEATGIPTWSPAGVIALHLAAVLRREAKTFVGLQEVSELIGRLARAYPALVQEVIPKVVGISQVVDVLRRLVDEGVCIRDLKSIVEAFGAHGINNDDTLFLTERCRAALGGQLAHTFAGLERRLHVVMLDPVIEETVESGISTMNGQKVLCLDPEVGHAIVVAVAVSLESLVRSGRRPVVLTHANIRRYLKKLLEVDMPDVAVLSYDELPPDLTIQPIGRATLEEAA